MAPLLEGESGSGMEQPGLRLHPTIRQAWCWGIKAYMLLIIIKFRGIVRHHNKQHWRRNNPSPDGYYSYIWLSNSQKLINE
jgi:hypothetical protein